MPGTVSTGFIFTLSREAIDETISSWFTTLNSNAKLVSSTPTNPSGETGTAHILLDILQGSTGRKCNLLNLREKWVGAKTTGAVVTVFGRFRDFMGNLVWRELPKADGVSSLNFGVGIAIDDGAFKYSPMVEVDTRGAETILVTITTASNAATSSVIEGHLVGHP